jgi:preprotein translocase subunit SecG
VITVLIVILHILVAFTLVLVVLLQVGKGGSISAAFGGGGSSQTLFGSRGPTTFLSHLTTAAAALFMLTSLTLAFLSSNARNQSSISDQIPAVETTPAPQAPASQAPPDSAAPQPPAVPSAQEGADAPPPASPAPGNPQQ